MKRHLTRLAVLLGCMLLLTAAVFADNTNTDDDKGDIDGSYTFTNETEKYGYRSYLYYDENDYDNFVGARLYDVTIPDEGRLVCEISSSQIRHMNIDIYSEELKKHIQEEDFELESSDTVTMVSMALPKGEYTVLFSYKRQPNAIIPYDEDTGEKYFNHYISWKKDSYVRGSSITLTKTSASMNVSDYMSLNATVNPSDAYYKDVTWSSSNTSIVKVDAYGGVTAVAPGTAVIKASTKDGTSASCKVTVNVTDGMTQKVSAGTVKVLSASSRTVALTKAVNKKSVTVPATVTIGGKSYKVTQINANAFKGAAISTVTIGKNVKVIKGNAFKGSKAKKVILKTKLLKKSKVKGCLKSSKVTTVQVKVGSAAVNKKYVKTYKKIFTKANAGKKVTVK